MSTPRKLHGAAGGILIYGGSRRRGSLGYIGVISVLLLPRGGCGRWKTGEYCGRGQHVDGEVEEADFINILGSCHKSRSCFAPVLPTLPTRPYFGNRNLAVTPQNTTVLLEISVK